MKRPEKKEAVQFITDKEYLGNIKGYNEACDDWEKWIKEVNRDLDKIKDLGVIIEKFGYDINSRLIGE